MYMNDQEVFLKGSLSKAKMMPEKSDAGHARRNEEDKCPDACRCTVLVTPPYSKVCT